MDDHAPDFSPLAAAYARGRPGYPAALYDWLASLTPRHDLAWDCATGNGQAAFDLAQRYAHVIATDRSGEQLAHARPHVAITYRQAPAEASGIPDSAVDLVTVAAAVHWFDHEAFGREVARVLRPGGVLAVWSYHAGTADPPIDRVIHRLYFDILQPYFARGARFVDEWYRTLPLPGTPIETPPFSVEARWTRDDLLANLNSWSGAAEYRRARGEDPIGLVREEIDAVWGDHPEEAIEIRWPLMMQVRRL